MSTTTLSMKNAISASFDQSLSSAPGRWEFSFDDDHPDHVTLRVCASEDSRETELISHLSREDIACLLQWMKHVHTHMPRADGAGDAVSDSVTDSVPDATSDSSAPPDVRPGVTFTAAQWNAAVIYNNARPYGPVLWREIQGVVGADMDGKPGLETARKVAAYQHRCELGVDGKVGPGTLGHMNIGPLRSLDVRAFFFLGRLAINADGAPDAYNPHDTGIDYLANAGRPGKWWGVATNGTKDPFIQDASDPNPGYYVSTTALVDSTYPRHDPRRYVDSNTIPFVVLPRNIHDLVSTPTTVRKGDLAVVAHRSRPEHVVYAIYADVGPTKRLDPTMPFGEGSIALAQALGHDPFLTRRGVRRAVRGITDDIVFLIFPGSGHGRPMDAVELMDRTTRVFNDWGGLSRFQQALALYND